MRLKKILSYKEEWALLPKALLDKTCIFYLNFSVSHFPPSETEARGSFGYSSLKSRGLQQLERETNLSDLEDNRNKSRSRKRATGNRSRSRSIASNKSLNASYMSGYSGKSGKENQSPMLRKPNGRSSKKQERKRSESLSISVTPKRRTS